MTENLGGRINELLEEDPGPLGYRPEGRKTLTVGGITIFVIVAAVLAFLFYHIHSHETHFVTNLEQRLGTLTQGRVEVIATWCDSVLSLGNRIAASEFYRDFATEMDLSAGDISKLVSPPQKNRNTQLKDNGDPNFEASPDARIPLMTHMLSEFVTNTGFLAGHLMDRGGNTFISTDFNIIRDDRQITRAKEIFKTGTPYWSPVRTAPSGFILDIYLPIYPLQTTAENNRAIGVLMLTRPVANQVAEFLHPPPFMRNGEAFRLLQRREGKIEKLRPGQVPSIVEVMDIPGLGSSGRLKFGKRAAHDGERIVYSLIIPVPGTQWLLLQESEAETVRTGVRDRIRTTVWIAVLTVIAVIIAVVAFWWRLVGDHNKTLATQFRSLAARIAAQKRFLDGINNTIQEHIGLKDKDGIYRYVNPAFADAAGQDLERVPGLNDAAIFGHGTAERLHRSDKKVLESGNAVTVDEEIYLHSRKHYMQISKVPLRDDSGEISGLVSVTRDISELVEQRKLREMAVKQTIVALVRAIELRDPYLSGHSRRLAGFAGEVARHIGAGPDQVATIEVAANLSQIGKLSINRILLNKPGRLTEEENKTMRKHVEHAAEVLKDLDFGLPVFDAIYQMNERPDGSGYPCGLRGDEICLEARILEVCNVFCARVEPRPHRPAIPPEKAVEILRTNSSHFDSKVVEVLSQILQSPQGDKLLQDLSNR